MQCVFGSLSHVLSFLGPPSAVVWVLPFPAPLLLEQIRIHSYFVFFVFAAHPSRTTQAHRWPCTSSPLHYGCLVKPHPSRAKVHAARLHHCASTGVVLGVEAPQLIKSS